MKHLHHGEYAIGRLMFNCLSVSRLAIVKMCNWGLKMQLKISIKKCIESDKKEFVQKRSTACGKAL